jgi:hypothetical protein
MEITMKSKLIVVGVCLGILGGTLACAGEEEAMTVSDESAAPLSGAGEGESLKMEDRQGESPKMEDRKSDEGPRGEGEPLTNADCIPTSVPDSAPANAKICVGLAKSHPDMVFTPNDYRGMPEDCKPYVNPKCR